jgi:transcriptional regulator with XRE-family HTH domain
MSQSTKTKIDKRLEELKELLAVRLQDVLDQQDLSQSQLAKRAELKIPYVNRILKKKANATLESIARLETALNMALISDPLDFRPLSSKSDVRPLEGKPKVTGFELTMETESTQRSSIPETSTLSQ